MDCWLTGQVEGVVVKGGTSHLLPVTSRVSQDSILDPVFFDVFAHGLDTGLKRVLSKFTDDMK